MAHHTIKMPDVGEGVTEAEIVAWHVALGDKVEEDQELLDVMTDKATVEIPAPVSGTVVKRIGEPGDLVPVGSEIIVIDTDGSGVEADAVAPAEAPPPAAEPVSKPDEKSASVKQDSISPPSPAPEPKKVPEISSTSRATTEKPLASPAVRQRALELHIDLSDIVGSGPAGRIVRTDLDEFVAAGGRALKRQSSHSTSRTGVKRTATHQTKIVGLRRKIAQNMERAWSVPMITYVEEIDVTEVDNLRKHLNSKKEADQPKLTLLPFLARALIEGLGKVPQANAHYDAEAGLLTEFEGVHLGIATATDKGLIVPVVKHAEALSVWETATEIKRLSEDARSGKATREELSGSSITITSLGAIGGVVTTPILNVPETAIVGVNKIVERPVFDGAGRVVPRQFMNLSCSFDHRIVDGFDAATLVQTIREKLETPATLFM